jgi:hypothetical protein
VIAGEVRQKLGRLIRLLGSEHDGEALAACRALGRTLKSAGADLHALAADVEAPAKVVERLVWRDRPAHPPHKVETPTSWAELAAWMHDRRDQLTNEREREFVDDMVARLFGGGDPTERQAAWMRTIYAKLRKAAA